MATNVTVDPIRIDFGVQGKVSELPPRSLALSRWSRDARRTIILQPTHGREWAEVRESLRKLTGPLPIVIGLGKRLSSERRIDLLPRGEFFEPNSIPGRFVWAIPFYCMGSLGLRLQVRLERRTPRTVVWIVGEDGKEYVVVTGAEEVGGDLTWTPLVGGESGYLVIGVPAEEYSERSHPVITVVDGLEVLAWDQAGGLALGTRERLGPKEASIAPCPGASGWRALTEADLTGAIEDISLATAGCSHVGTYGDRVVGVAYTASLIRRFDDKTGSRALLLAANHCFTGDSKKPADKGEINGFVGFWNYRVGRVISYNPLRIPDLRHLPLSKGGRILVADTKTDVALLQLAQSLVGCGLRAFLGWTTRNIEAGARVLRVSHPYGYPQSLSTGAVTKERAFAKGCWDGCKDRGYERFTHVSLETGADTLGTSGSALVIDDDGKARIIGQHWGQCRSSDSAETFSIDGRLAESYPYIKADIGPWNRTGARVSRGHR